MLIVGMRHTFLRCSTASFNIRHLAQQINKSQEVLNVVYALKGRLQGDIEALSPFIVSYVVVN
jgi:uncharacterized membrane-anchored protein